MEKFIIFFDGVPTYQVEAQFYCVEENFMNFYDIHDNLIGSFNTDLIDFVVSDKFSKNVCELTIEDDECTDCDCENCCDKDCEDEIEDSDCEDWPYRAKNKNKVFNEDFDNIMKKILLHGEK